MSHGDAVALGNGAAEKRPDADRGISLSELRLRALVDAVSAITWCTPPDGFHIEPEPSWMAFTGQSAEDMLGAGWAKAVHPDDLETVKRQWEIAVRDGVPYRSEHRIRRHDGQWRWMLAQAVPIRDETGRIVELFGMNVDITERKNTENALRASEEKFRAIFESAALGIVMRDLQGRFITCNPAFARIVGYSEAELLKMEFEPIIHPDDRTDNNKDVPRLVTGEIPNITVENRYVRKDGEVVWVRKFVSLLHDETGQPSRFLAVVRNITGLRRAETELRQMNATLERRVAERTRALREADRRKDEFLATLAHELRNPLAPIRNGIAVLARPEERQTALQSRLLGMMERQVDHLVRLVDDLLDVSRISYGKFELQKAQTELAKILHQAVEMTRLNIEKSGLALSLSLPSEPVAMFADPVRLTQVFANILGNSARYSNPGGHIALTAHRIGQEAVVSITDDGLGISPDLLPNVFRLFEQGTGSAERPNFGLGIGLSLARAIVTMHGGRIEARSAGEGQGSTFTVHLPIEAAAAEDAPGAGEAPSHAGGGGVRVLVVDDDRDAADSLRFLLETLGADVQVAYDGRTGAEMVESFHPAVVFLDLGMPAPDGYATAGMIRARQTGPVPQLVALTGWGRSEDRVRTKEAGFDAHMTKPAAVEDLERILQKVA